MLDGNVLLRQKRDEVPEGTLSCPDRNLAVFHHYRHYEGLRLLPSVCDSKLIQQTLIKNIRYGRCRNMIGGSTIAILIQLAITIYSAIKGYSLFCPIISITISCMLNLYMFYIYKQAGIEYAKELFENYLICKNNE